MSDTKKRARKVEVVCNQDVWGIREDANDNVQQTFENREKTVAEARSMAQRREAVLVIYDEDGSIEEEQDYGTMGVRPSPESDISGPGGQRAVEQAEQRSMQRG